MKLTAKGSFEEVNEIMGMVGENKILKPKNVILEPSEDGDAFTLEIIFQGEETESSDNLSDNCIRYAIKCYEDGEFKGYYMQFNTKGIDVVPMRELAVIEDKAIAEEKIKTLTEIHKIRPNHTHHFEIEEF
ncbi:hypothetical protein [Bacillus thuringiensis]|uniref:hypothetical protein n=1 Tax=Bacillus thuringiensis TaxID=1428 RepID=UPI003F5BD5DF